MKKNVIILSILLLFFSVENKSQNKKPTFTATGKKITVYTTADSSKYRLTQTGTFEFGAMGQPLETQICIFVDPSKTFQTYVGTGGALTDAAAETFAKLPADKQKEF